MLLASTGIRADRKFRVKEHGFHCIGEPFWYPVSKTRKIEPGCVLYIGSGSLNYTGDIDFFLDTVIA